MLTVKELIAKKAKIEKRFNETLELNIDGLGVCKFRKITRSDVEGAEKYKFGEMSNEYLVANTMLEPDLTDSELLKAFNSNHNIDLVSKLMTYGEIRNVATKLSDFSGFDDECVQIVEKLKN